MNFHLSDSALPILRVLVVNPLAQSSRCLITKILSGIVFGRNQLIDVILLVYSNEKPIADDFRLELIVCAFPCAHSIIISSELPSITDADIFCFLTNFPNPNRLNFEEVNTDEQFDTFYLIIKIAHNFAKCYEIEEEFTEKLRLYKKKEHNVNQQLKHKPILVADGLVALDILASLAPNIPHDALFSPTPHIAAAKSILADYLKVQCNMINDVFVWAANDIVFHIEIEKPIILDDGLENPKRCDWDRMSNKLLKSIVADHTQFSPSWLKKDFIDKVSENVVENPYGGIYKAMEMSRILRVIWKSRSSEQGNNIFHSLGVISDGSLETIKGCPYILPVILSGETWSAYKQFKYDSHVRQEIKRINNDVSLQHKKLIPYCKKFLDDNVINQAFVPPDDESESIYFALEQSSRRSQM